MRSIRAIPGLDHVRQDSNRQMAMMLAEFNLANIPGRKKEEAYRQARLGIEIGYAAMELMFDEPALDRDKIIKDCAIATARFTSGIET